MSTPGPPAEWYPDPGGGGGQPTQPPWWPWPSGSYPPPPGAGGYPPPPATYPPPPGNWGWDYPSGGYPPRPQAGTVQIPGIGPVVLATIWQRALARIIDSAIYLVLGVVAMAVGTSATVSPTDSYTGFQFHVMFAFVLAAMFTAAVALLYEWLFVAFRGATPGKMALRIKVVDQNTGGLMGLGPAFVRPLIILVPTVFPYLGMLISLAVLLSPLFDASGRLQGWHDKAAGDLVIGTGQRTAAARNIR